MSCPEDRKEAIDRLLEVIRVVPDLAPLGEPGYGLMGLPLPEKHLTAKEKAMNLGFGPLGRRPRPEKGEGK